jgi:A/G-specific adenine glycosylase
MKADFTKKLMKWNRDTNTRAMPWKGEKDPYKIWLSEIILQQTRVEQGLAYYERFVKAFPTVQQLARAPEQKVFKLWEGLGYYTRCKNLVATAKYITEELQGVFPSTYDDILGLKGIGPYTAAAIASFAYQLPHAVLDGNVFRVLSRYFGISTPIDSTSGKQLYTTMADSLLDHEQPGLYNQAIMDFGATVCTPRQPDCARCVQHKDCQAFQNGWVDQLPIKEKQLKKKTRWLYYFIVRTGNDDVLIRKRGAKDIWENLYEFVLYENEGLFMPDEQAFQSIFQQLAGKTPIAIKSISPEFRQQLTHQTISGRFIVVTVPSLPPGLKDYEQVKWKNISKYAFPRFITAYLQKAAIVPAE